MPTTFIILRWMTHLNIGAFLATLLWLGWMYSMLSDAMPSPSRPAVRPPVSAETGTELRLIPVDALRPAAADREPAERQP